MAKYNFGAASTERLLTCEKDIQLILNETIKVIDFTVVYGHRTQEEQDNLYPKFSKVKFPNSKHNPYPSQAVDVAPFIKPYGYISGSPEQIKQIAVVAGITEEEARDFVLKAYARLIGHIERVAFNLGIEIRAGMDWDGDFDTTDQKFHDLGHIELKR